MTKKRMLAFVLALLMCLTVLPAGALAANDGELVSNAPETIAAPIATDSLTQSMPSLPAEADD